MSIAGRNPALTHEEIEELVQTLKKHKNLTIRKEEVEDFIKKRLKKNRKNGCVQLSPKIYSQQSIRNIVYLIVAHPDMPEAKSAISKTNTCLIAENSIIAAISFLLVVAATHYIVGEQDEKQKQQLKWQVKVQRSYWS